MKTIAAFLSCLFFFGCSTPESEQYNQEDILQDYTQKTPIRVYLEKGSIYSEVTKDKPLIIDGISAKVVENSRGEIITILIDYSNRTWYIKGDYNIRNFYPNNLTEGPR
jgi:glutathionyl-hydroquinone reductase